MRPVIVVAVIVVVWVAAMSVPPVSDLPRTETPRTLLPKRHYCGSGLTNALKLLCGGVYNTVETIVTPTSTILITGLSRSRRKAYSFLPSLRRSRRGVYDECCRKSCTIEEISSYCAAP